MRTKVDVKGKYDAKFRSVKEAFAENFALKGELGAAVAVYLDDKPVVDLWGGYADAARSRAWQQDTILTVYSVTKAMATICALRLVEQGKLDMDAPVARYWPEFAQAGKADLPVCYLLNHQAGLPSVKKPLPAEALFDWKAMTQALAAQEPWWKPGTQHGYHTMTFGWLVGEVVRRASGKSLGTFWRDEVAGPLGVDFYIGLPAEYDARTVDMIPAPPPPPGEPGPMDEIMKNPRSMQALSFCNPPWTIGVHDNSRQWRGAEVPAGNGQSNARAVARIFGALAVGGELDGVRVLSAGAIKQATVEQSCGQDPILGVHTRFGLGFWLTNETFPMGPNPRAFGHPGYGGHLGFADLDARLGFGYTMNQIGVGIGLDPRAKRLVEATYASL